MPLNMESYCANSQPLYYDQVSTSHYDSATEVIPTMLYSQNDNNIFYNVEQNEQLTQQYSPTSCETVIPDGQLYPAQYFSEDHNAANLYYGCRSKVDLYKPCIKQENKLCAESNWNFCNDGISQSWVNGTASVHESQGVAPDKGFNSPLMNVYPEISSQYQSTNNLSYYPPTPGEQEIPRPLSQKNVYNNRPRKQEISSSLIQENICENSAYNNLIDPYQQEICSPLRQENLSVNSSYNLINQCEQQIPRPLRQKNFYENTNCNLNPGIPQISGPLRERSGCENYNVIDSCQQEISMPVSQNNVCDSTTYNLLYNPSPAMPSTSRSQNTLAYKHTPLQHSEPTSRHPYANPLRQRSMSNPKEKYISRDKIKREANNERERKRVQSLNDAFTELKDLCKQTGKSPKTKVGILRSAADLISSLRKQLEDCGDDDDDDEEEEEEDDDAESNVAPEEEIGIAKTEESDYFF